MSYYAELDPSGVVLRVIVADAEIIKSYPGTWVETFMDAAGGKHYAGIGYRYRADMGDFIPPQPFPSWVLNATTHEWVAPVAYPKDGLFYAWNEPMGIWEAKKS